MAQVGWVRFAVPVDSSFRMFSIDLGLLGKTSDDDHALSTRFLDDLYECALRTTAELIHHLISTDTLLAFSPKANSAVVFASSEHEKLIRETVGYYSSKAIVTLVEQGIDRHLLGFALNEFLEQSLASTSPSRPVVRVKDVFILGPYYKSTDAGSRYPAFSIQVATNTEHTNRILVDLKLSPQSVAFRSLHLSSNYTIEEDEDPLRCIVLPSLKTALVKSHHERPPLESTKSSWADFVDYYDRHHKLHLPDETEERGYATVIINNSLDPNRFTSAYEDVVPVATLWTESGLSRRDLHGEPGDLLPRYLISHIASLESLSVSPTSIPSTEGETCVAKRLIFVPLRTGSFPDIMTTKNDEIVEKRKELRRKGSGFIKSSRRASQPSEDDPTSLVNTSLDASIASTDTSSQKTCSEDTVLLSSQLEASQTFDNAMFDFESIRHPILLEDVLQSINSTTPSSGHSQGNVKGVGNKPVQFRANVRLGARLAPGKTLTSTSFTPISPSRPLPNLKSNAPKSNTESEAGDVDTPKLTQANLKKRKLTPALAHQSPIKAFQPPRPKISKS